MLTEFFMERAQIVLSADAERFIGTVPMNRSASADNTICARSIKNSVNIRDPAFCFAHGRAGTEWDLAGEPLRLYQRGVTS